ncbi:MAG: type 4 pilus major pilin [Pseudomonadota bacterium]
MEAVMNEQNVVVEESRKREAGFSGLEMVGVFLFFLTMVAGGAWVVSDLFEGSKVAELQQGVASIRMNVQQMYASSTDYTGLDNTAAIAAGAVPSKMVDDSSTIMSPWGDAITVAPGTDTKNFTITVTDLPQSACVKLSQFQAYAWEDITVGGTTAIDLTVQAASALCTADGLSVVFTGR